MKLRHELKHEISYSDMLILRQRLKAVTKPDEHSADSRYFIRSLYFDNIYDKALLEKVNGINVREKFRIRFYNEDTSFIRLEKKSKINGLGNKTSALISEKEARAISKGDFSPIRNSDNPLILEFYSKALSEGLRPKTIVDYTREAFIYPAGNVRVTLDYDIRTGKKCADFLNPECITIPAGNSPIILEVKWDEFLPSVIGDIVQLKNRRSGAFSKYAACRIYG